jgi:hypothetical protein
VNISLRNEATFFTGVRFFQFGRLRSVPPAPLNVVSVPEMANGCGEAAV